MCAQPPSALRADKLFAVLKGRYRRKHGGRDAFLIHRKIKRLIGSRAGPLFLIKQPASCSVIYTYILRSSLIPLCRDPLICSLDRKKCPFPHPGTFLSPASTPPLHSSRTTPRIRLARYARALCVQHRRGTRTFLSPPLLLSCSGRNANRVRRSPHPSARSFHQRRPFDHFTSHRE